MDSTYICPECGQEYDEPGVCDSCQVDLIEDGGDEELGDDTDELGDEEDSQDSFGGGDDEEEGYS